MKDKVCCVTGQENIPFERDTIVKYRLRLEILRAIEERYTKFISGFSSEAELYLAELIIEMKKSNPNLILEAALYTYYDTRKQAEKFYELLNACDIKKVHINRHYYIAEQSERIIAVYGGNEKSDTWNVIQQAMRLKRDIYILCE
jgi:hypothetical protein